MLLRLVGNVSNKDVAGADGAFRFVVVVVPDVEVTLFAFTTSEALEAQPGSAVIGVVESMVRDGDDLVLIHAVLGPPEVHVDSVTLESRAINCDINKV